MATMSTPTRLRDVLDHGRELADHLDVQSEILRLAPFGVAVIDEEGVICGVNRYLRNKLGYIWRSDLVGNKTVIEALLPDEIAERHKALRMDWFRNPTRFMLHGRNDQPFYTKHKQGQLIRCFLAVYPLEKTRCGDMICVEEASEDSRRYAIAYFVFPEDFAGAQPDAASLPHAAITGGPR